MADNRNKQMTLIGFLQAQNCSVYPGPWRHEANAPDFTTPEYYQRIARTLEEGKFHLAFFDDRLAMPDIYGNDHARDCRAGVRAIKLDLTSIMTAMGMATSNLGLGVDVLDHLLRALSHRAKFRHARPDDEGPCRMERRHVAQRFGSRQLRPRASISNTTCATTAPTSSWKWSWATGTPGRTAR